MPLFRLVDLPRRVRRLAAPLPLDPAATDTHGPAGPPLVGWTLEPTLLNPRSHRLWTRVARVIALYAKAEGQPRAVVEALSPRIEEVMGNYRLGRCIARTVEHCAYEFTPPPVALSHEPAALRALCYRRAQEQYGGYVPRARRAAFLAAIAAELDATPAQLEDALFTHGDRRSEQRDGTISLGKAWLVSRLQALLQTGRILLPRTTEAQALAEELLDYEIRVDARANDTYGAFTVGSHDDLVTALGLAVQPPKEAGVLYGRLRAEEPGSLPYNPRRAESDPFTVLRYFGHLR